MKYMIGIALCLAGLSVPAQPEDVDPVVRAKAHRAIRDSQDLPPIPRGLTEPPPLPPPELHTHDIRRHRRGAARGAARSRKAQPGRKGAQMGAQMQKTKAKANTQGAQAKTQGQAKAQAKAAPPKKAGGAAKAPAKNRQAGQAKKS
jgi:hypothetical protein